MIPEGRPSTPLNVAALGWLWRVSLSTPALYMILSIIARRWLFEPGQPEGLARAPESMWTLVRALAASAGVASVAAMVWLRRQRERVGVERYARHTFWMLALCDLVAFCGLVLYLIQGDYHAQAALSLVAWLDYAIARPGSARRFTGP